MAVFCALQAPDCARAVVLDWDQSYGTWTAGAPVIGSSASQSYDNDPGRAGNDITITLTNNGGNWGTGYPAVNTNYNGGTGQNTLAFNYATQTTNSPDLTVTISFINYSAFGVTGVNFQIFDVDYNAGTWIDQISNITALTKAGTTIGATTVSGSLYNTVTGTGTGILVTGVTGNAGGSSNRGNVSINFGTAVVTQVSFQWSNIDAARGDQKIALYDINYVDAAPEVNPGLAAVLLCGLVIACRHRAYAYKNSGPCIHGKDGSPRPERAA